MSDELFLLLAVVILFALTLAITIGRGHWFALRNPHWVKWRECLDSFFCAEGGVKVSVREAFQNARAYSKRYIRACLHGFFTLCYSCPLCLVNTSLRKEIAGASGAAPFDAAKARARLRAAAPPGYKGAWNLTDFDGDGYYHPLVYGLECRAEEAKELVRRARRFFLRGSSSSSFSSSSAAAATSAAAAAPAGSAVSADRSAALAGKSAASAATTSAAAIAPHGSAASADKSASSADESAASAGRSGASADRSAERGAASGDESADLEARLGQL